MASQDTKEDPYVYFSNVPSSTAIQDPREEPSNNHYVIPSVVISIDSSVFPSSIPSSSSSDLHYASTVSLSLDYGRWLCRSDGTIDRFP